MYVYSYDANKIKRISVNLDTNNGKHFTTADNPVGAEKMSVAIKTLRPIYYGTKNVDFNYTDFSRGGGKVVKR
ncbi:hypothetical protein ARAF_0087 [Arsenophonus endosymbiont of Aleurodicus floccissimus]|uniref:hypothetical protein n=1 Tax=Arsenophonus endosymbiont of Aleurodicus floccissimus TaxID=2152761 RepID=UPI000E6B2265|nr:hypothetical protein [Arsenophonus endosymbiont of Aleurodicus floccissimus]SPP30985.1 hypothetical protein ARAF_0087 [Arsenophonus endosymbiont of Aleurodicus floccissimus]